MSPEVRQELNRMQQEINNLKRAEELSFIESIARRLVDRGFFLPFNAKLSDLSDVEDTDSASTGEVLKKTSTTWQPGTDNTA